MTRLISICYYLLIFSLMFPPESDGKAGFIQRVFRECDSHNTNVTRLEKIHFKRKGEGILMSFDFVVVKDYFNEVKVSLDSQKCDNGDALDTCETTSVFTINNNCKLLRSQPWKSFAMAASPPLNCPLKKMTHSIRNASVEIPNFLLLRLGNGYYKTKVIFRDQVTDELIMCVYGESLLYSYKLD